MLASFSPQHTHSAMHARDRAAHDVLGRMSDDDDDDDVPSDLDLTFVPKSERMRRLQQARPTTATTTMSAIPDSASTVPTVAIGSSSTTITTSSVPSAVTRTETVYEQERNAKVRAVLAEQSHHANRGIFTADLFDAAVDALPGLGPASSTSLAFSPTTGQPYAAASTRGGAYRGRRPYDSTGSRGMGGAGAQDDTQRRGRMPHTNMSDEEQARFIRSRRNMAVTRNALREVDPETLEYAQVTQALDQVVSGRGLDFTSSGGGGRGRGGSSYRGRGMGYRGRGTGGGESGRGGGRGGRGYGGGVPFRPYS